MLFNIIPIEFIEKANIPLEKNIKIVEHIISKGFCAVMSPYPTVAIVVAAPIEGIAILYEYLLILKI